MGTAFAVVSLQPGGYIIYDNFLLNCVMYRDVPYCIICVSCTSILEYYYENKSLVSIKQQLD